MAFTFGFYDSLNGDRKYNATQVSEIFDGLITDGVFATIGEMFMVDPGSSGLEVVVKTGRAWFNHTWNKNDSWMVLTLDTPDILLSRIDTIVIEVDASTAVRTNSIKIVKGAPATVPQKPSLLNEEFVHQYALAHVTVRPAAESIVNGDIENVVGTNKQTPFVTGILSTVPIDDLFDKWDGEFHTWFEHIKLELTEDVVSNLQRQIDEKLDVSDKATEEDVKNKDPNKWISADLFSENKGAKGGSIGDIVVTARDLESEDPRFVRCDWRAINAINEADFLKGRPEYSSSVPSTSASLTNAQTWLGAFAISDNGDYARVFTTGTSSDVNVLGNTVAVYKKSEDYRIQHILPLASGSNRCTVCYFNSKLIVLSHSNATANGMFYNIVDPDTLTVEKRGNFAVGGISGNKASGQGHSFAYMVPAGSILYVLVFQNYNGSGQVAIGYTTDMFTSVSTVSIDGAQNITVQHTYYWGTDSILGHWRWYCPLQRSGDKMYLFYKLTTPAPACNVISSVIGSSEFNSLTDVASAITALNNGNTSISNNTMAFFQDGYVYVTSLVSGYHFHKISLSNASVSTVELSTGSSSNDVRIKLLLGSKKAFFLSWGTSSTGMSRKVVDLETMTLVGDLDISVDQMTDIRGETNYYLDAILLYDRFIILAGYTSQNANIKTAYEFNGQISAGNAIIAIIDTKYSTSLYFDPTKDIPKAGYTFATVLKEFPDGTIGISIGDNSNMGTILFDFNKMVLPNEPAWYLKVKD